MMTLSASKVRIPPDTFNRVAYQGERVRVDRRGAPSVAIVSLQDLELLEFLEDQIDRETAERAIAEMKASGQEPVAWEQVKARLGL
jgi:PHD/YefM family antitoxin component YafN of YafNO toxin-antitoxin module